MSALVKLQCSASYQNQGQVWADCSANTIALLQALGTCETPRWIKSEIGDLGGVTIAPEPLLTFRRYDLGLEHADLVDLGAAVTDRDLADLREIANPGGMRRVYDLAKAAAAQQIPA